jgi:hypothetical protein
MADNPLFVVLAVEKLVDDVSVCIEVDNIDALVVTEEP